MNTEGPALCHASAGATQAFAGVITAASGAAAPDGSTVTFWPDPLSLPQPAKTKAAIALENSTCRMARSSGRLDGDAQTSAAPSHGKVPSPTSNPRARDAHLPDRTRSPPRRGSCACKNPTPRAADHDHELDPIPTKHYYALARIFASTMRAERPLFKVEHILEQH
jgi:hypothetical protein